MFQASPSEPLLKVANEDIFGFSKKETGGKCVSRCHLVSFVMYIYGAKFEEHCSYISGVSS